MTHIRRVMTGVGVAALAVGLAVATGAAPAWAQPTTLVPAAGEAAAPEVQVPVNRSHIVQTAQPFTDILIGNPDIADVVTLSDRRIYVLGKAFGTTSLTIYGAGGRVLSVMDVVVTPDLPGLRQRLHEIVPGAPIEVRAAADAILLSGVAPSAAVLDKALAVAENYAPGKVTNLVTLGGSQQVMLHVRFAEVQRSAAKQLGVNFNAFLPDGDDFIALATGIVPSLTPFGVLAGSLTNGSTQVDVLLDALERDGVVKTLAEPNLIATSGVTASFLAGGEFPIPVGQDEDENGVDITIEFKEFGVKLAFTPTVLDQGVINLVVEPEVSAIDPGTSIQLGGLTIPGLTTRRASTAVDLRHGESFAIAGLIRSDFTDEVEAFPGLGEVPVLGALFRSAEFQSEETELVIIVTPYLTRPARPDLLRLPTDTFREPTAFDLFMLGRIESATAPAAAGTAPPGSGLAGGVGYIVR